MNPAHSHRQATPAPASTPAADGPGLAAVADHRPEARTQQHRQAIADTSPQAVAQRQRQANADRGTGAFTQRALPTGVAGTVQRFKGWKDRNKKKGDDQQDGNIVELQDMSHRSVAGSSANRGTLPVASPAAAAAAAPVAAPMADAEPALSPYQQQIQDYRSANQRHLEQHPGATSGPDMAPPGVVRHAPVPAPPAAPAPAAVAPQHQAQVQEYRQTQSKRWGKLEEGTVYGRATRPGLRGQPAPSVAPARSGPSLMTMTDLNRRQGGSGGSDQGHVNHSGGDAMRVGQGGGGTRQAPGGGSSGSNTMVLDPSQPAEPLHLVLRLRGEQEEAASGSAAQASSQTTTPTPVTDGNHPLNPAIPQPLHMVPANHDHPLMEPAPAPAPDPMNDFLNRRRNERQRDIDQTLGTGRRDTTHYGTGEGGDLRAVTTDPRFNTTYQVHRPSDQEQNPVKRVVKSTKEKVKSKFDKGLKTVGIRKNAPGEDFSTRYARRNETTGDKVKRVAKTAVTEGADLAAGSLPFVSTAKSALSAVNAHQQAGVADQAAQDATVNVTGQNIATGIGKKARKERRDHTMNAVGGAVADIASVTPAGPVAKNTIKGIRYAAKAGAAIYDAATSTDREARMQADADVDDPTLDPQALEDANAALQALPTHDTDAADAMLGHLAMPALDEGAEQGQNSPGPNRHDRELALHNDLQRPEGDHTLRPSEVSRQARRENARLRLRTGMGGQLDALHGSQQRTWTNVAGDAARSVRDRVVAARSSESPEEMELSDLSRRDEGQ